MMIEDVLQKQNTIYETREKYLTVLVCFLVGLSPVQGAILNILRSVIVLPYKIDTVLLYGIYICILIHAIKPILYRVRMDAFLVLLFFGMQWSLSFILNSYYEGYYLKIGYELFFTSIPFYVLVRCIKDYSQLKKYITITSIFISASMFVLIFIFNIDKEVTYSQSAAYMLLPAAVISLNVLFEKIDIIHLANALVATSLIIGSGARGPLVCIVLFIATKIILQTMSGFKNMITIIIIATFFVFNIKRFWSAIILGLQEISIKYGLSERVISALMNNNFFEDSERASLRDISLKIISESPLWGTGIAKDRLILTKSLGRSLTEALGLYPHNLILEILLQFGMLFGILIIVFLVYLIMTALMKTKDNDLKDILSIFLAIGLYPLFLSGSYLGAPLFFAFLGFCVNALKMTKNISKS